MEALAQLAGTTASQINKLEKRQRRLTEDWLVKLAQALHCNPEDLIDGARKRSPRADQGLDGHLYIPECRLAPIDEDGPAEGLGHFEDYAIFRADWLKSLSSNSYDKIIAYVVADDSMEPTLRSGDHVLVEPTGDRMRGDGVYVIKMPSGLAIKRVVFAPTGQTVDILSDNPVYPAHERVARSNISLIGRVVWVGRRL